MNYFRAGTFVRPLVGILSLLAMAGTSTVLVGDSADDYCKDGYVETKFAATFDSDCPPELTTPSGTLRLTLTKPNAPAIAEALSAAGIKTRYAAFLTTPERRCKFSDIPMSFGDSTESANLCRIKLTQAEQSVVCTIPPALRAPAEPAEADSGLVDASDSVEDGGLPVDLPAREPKTTCTIHFKPIGL